MYIFTLKKVLAQPTISDILLIGSELRNTKGL